MPAAGAAWAAAGQCCHALVGHKGLRMASRLVVTNVHQAVQGQRHKAGFLVFCGSASGTQFCSFFYSLPLSCEGRLGPAGGTGLASTPLVLLPQQQQAHLAPRVPKPAQSNCLVSVAPTSQPFFAAGRSGCLCCIGALLGRPWLRGGKGLPGSGMRGLPGLPARLLFPQLCRKDT